MRKPRTPGGVQRTPGVSTAGYRRSYTLDVVDEVGEKVGQSDCRAVGFERRELAAAKVAMHDERAFGRSR